MIIDESIDRLQETLAALGFTVAEGPVDKALWERLDRELSPLALPADLRRLLERVDVAGLPLSTYPRPSTLEFALWSWRESRDGEGGHPVALFPWCYEGHNHLLVELDGAGVAGGSMFEWGFGDEEFTLRFHTPSDWIETAIALLEEGAFDRHESQGSTLLLADTERWNELAAARRETAGPHPIYGAGDSVAYDETRWPAHWREANRLVHVDPPAEFPPMTIAEVLERRRHETVRALVTGTARYLSGTAGNDARFRLEDTTGALDVLSPVDIRGHAALMNTHEPLGVELVAEQLTGPRPRVDWYALLSQTDRGISRGNLLDHQPPDAIATIVHRSAT